MIKIKEKCLNILFAKYNQNVKKPFKWTIKINFKKFLYKSSDITKLHYLQNFL